MGINKRALELTPRQIDVLQCAADGHNVRATAALLKISDNTVKKHRSEATERLGAESIVQAVAMAIRRRLII